MVEIIDSLNIYFDSLDIVFTTDSVVRSRRLHHHVIQFRNVSSEQGNAHGKFSGTYPSYTYRLPGNKNWGIANNTAHEIGHTLTAKHNTNPNDLMNGETVFRYARFNEKDKEIMKAALVL